VYYAFTRARAVSRAPAFRYYREVKTMKGFVSPEASILDESAIVPDENLISPAPNQFTHELKRSQPYFFSETGKDKHPDGEFSAGTKVLLVRKVGDHCRVADQQGLYVEIDCDSLKEL
jgi:hypothetical protein